MAAASAAAFHLYIVMSTNTIPTQATQAATVSYYLEKIKTDLECFSREHNVSDVLMLCVLKQWAEDQLQTPI